MDKDIAIKLLEMNEGLPDLSTCNSVECYGIRCSTCPLISKKITLGDLRSSIPPVAPRKPPKGIAEDMKPQAPADDVKSPSHYQVFEGLESIEVIARSMTVDEFRGFCMGNVLKYRLRAGKKSELATVEKDLSKADYYKELFAKHKDQCRDAS